MDLNSVLMIGSVFILHAPCGAIILVKFPQLGEQFIRDRQKARNQPDPLIDFGLASRQLLCDAVVNAKHFSAYYNPAYYNTILGVKPTMISRTELDDPRNVRDGTLNYQRLLPTYPSVNLSSLRYVPRPLKFGKHGYEKVKTVQCVRAMKVKWYVTFGFVDHFMFLLEGRNHKSDSSLRISGLFEPSPVIVNLPEEYFHTQLQSSRISLMEKICEVGLNDRMRICGAVLDVLDGKGSLDRRISQNVLVKSRTRMSVWKRIKSSKELDVSVRVLRCTFRYKKDDWTPFYALADAHEHGAVFVLFAEANGLLYLHSRVVQVSAILYPVGPKKRTIRSKRGSGSRGRAKQAGRKKQRTAKNSNKVTEEDDDDDDDDDNETILGGSSVKSRRRGKGVQIRERGQENLMEAEQSEADTDNEDYIMSLLRKGESRAKEAQRMKRDRSQEDTDSDGDQSGSTSQVRDMRKTKGRIKERSNKDRKPYKKVAGSRPKKARSVRGRKQQTEEDLMEVSSASDEQRKQQTEIEHYRIRLRGKAVTTEKGKEQRTEIDDEEASSEDKVDDSEDEDYDLDEDIEINKDHNSSEDIEEDEDRAVSSRSKMTYKQRKKKNTEDEISFKGGTRRKIVRTEEAQEYSSEEMMMVSEEYASEEDAEDEGFAVSEEDRESTDPVAENPEAEGSTEYEQLSGDDTSSTNSKDTDYTNPTDETDDSPRKKRKL